MQVKKFEAPTIQEALDNIKRELGPEAIILQTKRHRRGFGLMSKDSVEVTAAVSERSLQKKDYVEKRLPDDTRSRVKGLAADRQAEFIEKYSEKHDTPPRARPAQATQNAQATQARRSEAPAPIDALLKEGTKDQVQLSRPSAAQVQAARTTAAQAPRASAASPMTAAPRTAAPAGAPSKRLTATRYVEIDEHEVQARFPEADSRAGVATSLAAAKLGQSMSVEEELRHLKRMIEEMKSTQDSIQSAPTSQMSSGQINLSAGYQDAYEQLILNGMDKRYAYSLMKKVAFELGEERTKNPEDVLDQLAVEIMQSTEIRSPLAELNARRENPESKTGGPLVVALVGPTGVGKTTTVAKMASEALLKRNLRVGLINLDSYKVAAFDQLGTYAKILNVPFRSCANGDDLRAAMQDFQSLDLVLVDTTGRSQRDPESLKEMQDTLSCIPQIRTQLVLSVTTRDSELYDMASRFSLFRPQGIIVSKLDEATIYGAIYNVSQKVKLPLLYFTTGQRVPEDIEEASTERVAALILDL